MEPPPASAAGVTDEEYAQRLNTIQMLSDVYGFPLQVATEAVDCVGTAIDTCVSYILDQQLAPDQGGPIVPKDTCPHVEAACTTPTVDAAICCGTVEKAIAGQTPSTLSCAGPSPNCKPCGKGDSTQKTTDGEVRTENLCGVTGEVWICLHCGGVFCSRYVHGHAVDHHQNCNGTHPVHVSISDLSVWCHACSAYISTHNNEELSKSVTTLEKWKFSQ